jgi:phosphate transport system substrate-binding protein
MFNQGRNRNKRRLVGLLILALVGVLGFGSLLGCGAKSTNGGTADSGSGTTTSSDGSTSSGSGTLKGAINVISREDGSGTRGAFTELFGVTVEARDGKKVDGTTTGAVVTNSTAVMLTTVAGDKKAIGYISLGSMNDSVKALSIDGTQATTANAESGNYKITRPFNIVTKNTPSVAAEDFINFIMSSEGQKVIVDNSYIAADKSAPSYESNSASGKVVVAGSSSVTPVMEKLKEAYAAANPNVSVEIQMSDSSTGVQMTTDGSCDIGMASRELKDSETAAGATSKVIAIDGIAVIVSKSNPLDGLTKEQVGQIFLGDITDWSALQ